MVHSLEEKLDVIKMHEDGAGIKRIAKRLGLSKSLITLWLEQYKQHGKDGFMRLPYNCRYNFGEKCQIICEIEEKHKKILHQNSRYYVSFQKEIIIIIISQSAKTEKRLR